MRIFISGGCKNGKSYYAQRLAWVQRAGRLYYVATMTPQDDEDGERIARHRRERYGWGFTTVEQPERIEDLLQKCDPGGSFLLDSLTALLANEMFPRGADVDCLAGGRVIKGLARVLGAIERIVIVSDNIFCDAGIYDTLTESYRMSLAALDRMAAENSDVVLEIAFSGVIIHKGGEIFDELYKKRV